MRNTISTCLLAIGVLLLVIGFTLGIALAADGYGHFRIVTAIYWWLSGLVSGFIFIGMAEIVNLLQKLLDKKSGVTPSLPSMPSFEVQGESEGREDVTFSSHGDKEKEPSEIRMKDLTIILDDERMKGEFWITDSTVAIVKKSMFQADTDQVVKVIPKHNLSSTYERDKDYLVYRFTEDNHTRELAFKTYNVYDYERIVNLLKKQ